DGEEGDDDDADQEVVRDDDNDDDEEGGDDEQESDEETREEESFDPIPQTPEDNEDEGDGEEDLGLNISEEERHGEEEEEDELYRGVNINPGRGLPVSLEVKDSHVTLTLSKPDGQQESSSVSSQFVTSLLNPTLDVGMESIFETTSQLDVPTPTSVAPFPITTPIMTSSTIATTTLTSQAPILPTTISSDIIQNLSSFGSLFRFDDRLRSLKQNFSEVMQTNQFADWLREEAQRENDEFLRTVDENIKKIIKEHVKEQVKTQVSKILPRIEQAVNEQLEAKVLTRSSHSSKTSYVVAADLSEMELKNIFIEKMEGNKSIQCLDEQRNLYKALVDAYESDKIILDTYRETEPESASTPTETATRSAGRSTQRSRSRQASASESALAEEPMKTTSQMEEPSHPEFDTGADDQPIVQSSQHPEWFSQPQKPPTLDCDWNKTLPAGSCKNLIELEYHLEEVYKATTDQLDWVNPEGQQYPHNLLQPLPLIPDNRGRHVIPFAHFINNDLEYLRGDLVHRTMWIQEPIDYDKHALWGVSPLRHKHQQFYGFAINWESARDVYSKRRIIAVTELKIVKWHSYKHLDWITVRRDDDKLYKSKEGDYKRLHIQDIKDMLLLLVQEKLTNLTVEEHFAFNVSLRMFTKSIAIQRRVKDLQLGVESYQKRLNLMKPDSYRSDLKRKEAYTTYSNPWGFIYQNKDKKNRLMQIDELHKFSDGKLTDVRTALDDLLKGIRMRYLPQTI
nr:hypothetical protein [Tanacetum cinerariifolium]